MNMCFCFRVSPSLSFFGVGMGAAGWLGIVFLPFRHNSRSINGEKEKPKKVEIRISGVIDLLVKKFVWL